MAVARMPEEKRLANRIGCNIIERFNREICRRIQVVATFTDGNSAFMLVFARLRHVVGTQRSNKKYMNMKHLGALCRNTSWAG